MIEKYFCFQVECECTNSSNDTVSTGDYEDSTAKHDYLDCEEGYLFVKAKTIADVEKLIGPNIISIKKLGPCY